MIELPIPSRDWYFNCTWLRRQREGSLTLVKRWPLATQAEFSWCDPWQAMMESRNRISRLALKFLARKRLGS